MSIAILQIDRMDEKGTVTSFILNESTGKLFLRLQDAAEHDGRVPNLNHRNGESSEIISTRIPIDKLINWIISSGYKLHTVLPFVYDGNTRRSPEKYIFEKVFGWRNSSQREREEIGGVGAEFDTIIESEWNR